MTAPTFDTSVHSKLSLCKWDEIMQFWNKCVFEDCVDM